MEEVVKTMHHSLAEVETETPLDTLHEASADTLAYSLAEVKPETLSDKLADEKAGTLDKIRH